MPSIWYHDHLNLSLLCRDLVTNYDYDLENILDVIDKPWHHRDEWQRFLSRQEGEAAAAADLREARNMV